MKRLFLLLGFIVLGFAVGHSVQYAYVDYGMHHQTGIFCFDYDRSQQVESWDIEYQPAETPDDTGVDEVEDYWRTANNKGLYGHGTRGYGGYNEV